MEIITLDIIHNLFQYLSGVYGDHGQAVPHHAAEEHRKEQDHVIIQSQQAMAKVYIVPKVILTSKIKKQENVCC